MQQTISFKSLLAAHCALTFLYSLEIFQLFVILSNKKDLDAFVIELMYIISICQHPLCAYV